MKEIETLDAALNELGRCIPALPGRNKWGGNIR